jgi:hypothetical protein
MACYVWLCLFLERKSEVSVRDAEGLLFARAQEMNREEIENYLNCQKSRSEWRQSPWTNVCAYSVLKRLSIFSVDECSIQLIKKPGNILAKKGVRGVHVLTSRTRQGNVTVLTCWNAEGQFLSPVDICKGINTKQASGDGLPPGSKLYVEPKSSYISSMLFLKWF